MQKFDLTTETNMLLLTMLDDDELREFDREKPSKSYKITKTDIIQQITSRTGQTKAEYLDQAEFRALYAEHRKSIYDKSLGFPINVPVMTLLYEQRDAIKDALCQRANKVVPGAFYKNKYRQWYRDEGVIASHFGIEVIDVLKTIDGFKGDKEFDVLYSANSILKTLTDKQAGFPYRIPTSGYLKAGYRLWEQKTSRESPKPTEGGIMAMAPLLRHCVQPKAGMALLTFDVVGQESWIMGQLSQDQRLIEGYRSGDIYAHVGRWLDIIPPDGNKNTHPTERLLAKILQLSISYGMGQNSINKRMGEPSLYRKHLEAFKTFWHWVQRLKTQALADGFLQTNDNWFYFVRDENVAYKLANAKIQSEAAGLMRRTLIEIPDQIDVICPLHDAVYVNCRMAEIDETIEVVRDAMVQAASNYFPGSNDFKLAVEVKVFREHEKYIDPRGTDLFNEMYEVALEAKQQGCGDHPAIIAKRKASCSA